LARCPIEVARSCQLTVERSTEPAEFRKFTRYRQILAVTLDWTDERAKAMFAEGLTQNISAGGLFVHINQCPPEGTVVHYDVFLPAMPRIGSGVRIAGTGKVVRVERLGGAGRWDGAAIRFSKHMIHVTKLPA